MSMKILKSIVAGFGISISPLLFAQGNFDDVEIHALQVRDNIYMLVGAGGNITVQTGEEGTLIIDTQYAELSDKIVAKIQEITDKPILYIINTHHHGDHVGGNANLKAAGNTVAGGNMLGTVTDVGSGAQILAHENAMFRMSAPTGEDADLDSAGWPTSTYFTASKKMYFNDEGIRIIHQPNTHTDGDSIVYFRKSDVIVAGDVFQTEGYPYIDLGAGGSIQGFLATANTIIEMMIPVYGQDGGTLVIPGHGRLSDIGDVLNWREMLTVITDRVQALIDDGMSLEEVLEAQPSLDYNARYGHGFVSTEDFLSAVYQNLSNQ